LGGHHRGVVVVAESDEDSKRIDAGLLRPLARSADSSTGMSRARDEFGTVTSYIVMNQKKMWREISDSYLAISKDINIGSYDERHIFDRLI